MIYSLTRSAELKLSALKKEKGIALSNEELFSYIRKTLSFLTIKNKNYVIVKVDHRVLGQAHEIKWTREVEKIKTPPKANAIVKVLKPIKLRDLWAIFPQSSALVEAVL